MCGIVGFVDTTGEWRAASARAVLCAMTDRLRHRGPDDEGAWIDDAAGVALGHRRLSILDLSPEGHQPMQSADGRYVIVYNGEIYNYRDIRRELEAGGGIGQWRGHSDTEVMLAAVARWGIRAALERFNGMFAFALYDRHRRELLLARDRLGEKPLYYGWMGGTLLFGSELKGVRRHPAWRGEIDGGALALYLRYNYIPAPHSIYRGIAKLPPGTLLTIPVPGTPGVLPDPVPYWSARQVAEQGASAPLTLSPHEIVESLDQLLCDAVALRMEADVPLGAFLSGGLDSSTIVALMQAQSSRPVQTFSIGFSESEYDEAGHAEAVARHLGTDHTALYVTPQETMAVIPRLPEYWDEPFGDSSQIPTYLVSLLARQAVTVSLSGDGGDELFGGYNRYFLARAIWRRVGWMPQSVRRAGAAGIRALSPDAWDAIYRSVEPVLPRRLRVRHPGDRAHKLAGILGVRDLVAMHRDLLTHWEAPHRVLTGGATEPSIPLTDRSAWARLDDFTHQMMYLDLVTYLPDDILVKLDRATMAVGLEGRVPFLDHRIVEFAWRMPLELKIRDGVGKWPLRQVLHRYVPESLVDRPKMGFGVPIDRWLRGPLREWAAELLHPSRLRREGYLDPALIQRRWTQHLGGAINWQYPLWDVLMFQAWLDAERS